VQGLLHGDIKPGNMAWDESMRLLGILDWGCAKSFGSFDVDGNYTYMPPECLKKVKLADGTEKYALYVPERMAQIFGS
jgi:serine/threonine protein kinase